MMIRWSIWLDKMTVAALKAIGEKMERPVGWIIRKAVEDFIERRKKDASYARSRYRWRGSAPPGHGVQTVRFI
jgi:predicted transcriptional regulator